mmetsp:Transcript_71613/g.202409  ORF Transcript_71613/g.202409 Transcript_71613/m.202409 type:complete len:211 (+) Transcript_71613:89-721(+)
MRLALTLGVALAAVAHSSAFHLPRTPRSPIVGRHGTRAPRRLVSAPRMGLMDDAANLPPQKVVDALANGGRFAASDVAAKTGSSIEEAKRALRDLAALLGEEAGLEVSSDGELIYKVRENTTRGAVVVEQQLLAFVLRPPHLPALTTHQKPRDHPPPPSTHRPHVPWCDSCRKTCQASSPAARTRRRRARRGSPSSLGCTRRSVSASVRL